MPIVYKCMCEFVCEFVLQRTGILSVVCMLKLAPDPLSISSYCQTIVRSSMFLRKHVFPAPTFCVFVVLFCYFCSLTLSLTWPLFDCLFSNCLTFACLPTQIAHNLYIAFPVQVLIWTVRPRLLLSIINLCSLDLICILIFCSPFAHRYCDRIRQLIKFFPCKWYYSKVEGFMNNRNSGTKWQTM